VKYEEINDRGMAVTTREGEKKTLAADSIITALPLLPNTAIVKGLEGRAEEVYAIGSCAAPGLIVGAIAGGARLGRQL